MEMLLIWARKKPEGVKGSPSMEHRESTLKTGGMRGNQTTDSLEKAEFLRIPLC